MKDNRQTAIAQIHIGKKQLGLDDETYRALLLQHGKKSSSADMALHELYKVIKAMESQGWKKKTKTRKQKDPQARKIVALWLSLRDAGAVNDASDDALNKFISGQTNVERIEWLNAKQANNVIEALKAWVKRLQSA